MASALNQKEYDKLGWKEKRGYTKEWSCKCNECGEKWHYLASVEKEMERMKRNNAFLGVGFCCNPCIASSTANANTQLEKQLADLRKCPKCGSSNVKRTAKYFKKT